MRDGLTARYLVVDGEPDHLDLDRPHHTRDHHYRGLDDDHDESGPIDSG